MVAIKILYLPRDRKLRTVVRTAIDFVEEVYKDEFIADIKLISFDRGDSVDVEQVKRIAAKEKLTSVFERIVRGLKQHELFHVPHYIVGGRFAWIPVSKHHVILRVFDIVAHELTHSVFFKLPEGDIASLTESLLLKDVGIKELMESFKVKMTAELAALLGPELLSFVHELATIYTVDNYFIYLQRTPTTPTTRTKIEFVATSRYFSILANPPRSRELAEILPIIYIRAAYDDLANFRRAVHEVLMKTVKKLPVDVLESNRAKYGMLYREEPVR